MARSKTSFRLLLATAVLSLLPLYGFWLLLGRGPLGHPATVLVQRGVTVDAMADQLEQAGVIRSAALFKLWAHARRLSLIRGEYRFDSRSSLAEVAGKLRRGDIHYTLITVPPGSHAWSIQHRFKDFIPEDVFWTLWKSPRLAQVCGFPDAEDLEGLVAPATYKVNHVQEPEEIFLMLAEAFRDKVRPSLDGGLLSPYKTLILASLVEKETSIPEELPRVAGVYAQRLRIGMRLQCDPTSLYARWRSGDLRFTGPTPEDIHRESRFNTYAVGGLPPTPIASPGPAAIAAARMPDLSPDLYFVATGKGGHSFAPSLAEHNHNVSLYRKELVRRKKAQTHG
ncbi:MAG: endolytic transglycosylase MltG [Holophaga sp.]|nr:endolytic transglycosylase MltG [Holophaga sp.]